MFNSDIFSGSQKISEPVRVFTKLQSCSPWHGSGSNAATMTLDLWNPATTRVSQVYQILWPYLQFQMSSCGKTYKISILLLLQVLVYSWQFCGRGRVHTLWTKKTKPVLFCDIFGFCWPISAILSPLQSKLIRAHNWNKIWHGISSAENMFNRLLSVNDFT